MDTSTRVVIVGAGCFGISTAYHLLKNGFTNITVVDRSDVLPAPDGSSTDMNRIVRTSYEDIFYSRFAQEAIMAWKTEPWTGRAYHECGILVLGSTATSYADSAYQNDVTIGARVKSLNSPDELHRAIPNSVSPKPPFTGLHGYLNIDGGWADAAAGLQRMTNEVSRLGGKLVPGFAVDKLLKKDGRTMGVCTKDGRIQEADHVVLASGAWTASTFARDLDNLDLDRRCHATGQTVATVQLTIEEAERFAFVPVVLNFATGFYVFPPNKENIVKFAIHDGGYAHPVDTDGQPISTPRTVLSNGKDGLRIPREAVTALRDGLRSVYPELAEKRFTSTRLCWYTNSPDSDWIIGPHPSDSGLSFATSGSGHAYKFLPVIGRLVADSLTGKLSPELAAKFAINRVFQEGDNSRPSSVVRELVESQLCTPDDLKVVGQNVL